MMEQGRYSISDMEDNYAWWIVDHEALFHMLQTTTIMCHDRQYYVYVLLRGSVVDAEEKQEVAHESYITEVLISITVSLFPIECHTSV